MEKEAKQPDKESQPAESMVFGTGTSKHSRPSSSSEGMSSFTVPRDLKGCSIVGAQGHADSKRDGALLAIGKEILLR